MMRATWLTAVLVIASALGCGDSGGIVAPLAEEGQAAGVIEVPSGYGGATRWTVRLAGAEAETVGYTWVGDLPAGEPTLAIVTDEADDVVLLGFVEPGRDNVLGPRSTAVVATFLAGHLFELPPQARLAALAELRAHPAMDGLGEVFADAMVDDPAALMSEDAALIEAVRAALVEVAASGAAPVVREGALNAGNANVVVEPSEAQRDVLVAPNLSGTGMQIHNGSRRLGWYYVYEVGYRDVSGAEFETDPPRLLAEGLVPSANGVNSAGGTIGTLQGALTGSLDFTAATLDRPVGIDVADGQTRLFAEAVVASAYLPGADAVPAWLDDSDPRHAEWLTRARLMTTASFVRDVLIPALFAIVLPGKGGLEGLVDFSTLDSLSQTLIAAAPGLAEQIADGDWGAALKTTLIALAGNSNLRTTVAFHFANLAVDAAEDQVATVFQTLGKANLCVALVDIGLAGLDIATVVDDVAEGTAAMRWDVTAIKAKVLVRAHRAKLDPSRNDTRLTATVQDAAPDEYHCFVWRITTGPGELSGLLTGPVTSSDRIAVSDDGEAWLYVDRDAVKTADPLVVVTVDAYPRGRDEACAYPPAGEAIGQGKVGVAGDSTPWEDACQDPEGAFDFDYWNALSNPPEYAVDGAVGETITVTVTIPPLEAEFEQPHRAVKVIIPYPEDIARDAVTLAGGEVRSWNISRGDIIEQRRGDDEEDAPYKYVHFPYDSALIDMNAVGTVRVSMPTRLYECTGCCPYIGLIPEWNRQALSGPLIYLEVSGSSLDGSKTQSVVDRVPVTDAD